MRANKRTALVFGAALLYLASLAGAQILKTGQAYSPASFSWSATTGNEAQGEGAYQKGTKALDDRQWDKAVEAFNEVLRLKGSRGDGALYWKAYAQNKMGKRADSLATLETLRKEYPNSRWLNDSKSLEQEIRQASGQPVAPEDAGDEDLKLMALNSLQNTDPERAIPLLEKFLKGNNPPKLKERALFVLAQSGSTQAREILTQVAKGNANPDLQMKALNYLGLFGGKASKQVLEDIYASSTDTNVKRQILHSFMVGGDKDRLLAAAKGEKSPELRIDAIHQLGVLGAKIELANLYQTETTSEGKEAILHALMISGGVDKLIEISKTEVNLNLRMQAIHSLGISGESQKAADALVAIYENYKDPSVRKAAIQGLFVQGNAKALISLAKKEADPAMKKDIVGKLSVMGSKEATDYLMEILNK